MSTVIPAESYRILRINATATEAGTLTVRGIWAQLPGGAPEEFLLPLATDDEERRSARRKSILDAESLRTKSSGLAARPEERTRRRQSLVETAKAAPPPTQTFLTCKVVEEQPLLRIRRTTLSHGAVMLYDGERCVLNEELVLPDTDNCLLLVSSTFRLTVENISSVPVDFIKLAFDDTSVSVAQQALAEGELSVAEAYETEYDLVHRPVFSYQGITNETIGPEKKSTIAVTCFGKRGWCAARITIIPLNTKPLPSFIALALTDRSNFRILMLVGPENPRQTFSIPAKLSILSRSRCLKLCAARLWTSSHSGTVPTMA